MSRDEVLGLLRERIVAFAASRHRGALPFDAAEDLAQEVLMVLQEKYAGVETMDELVPLGFQILRLKLLSARRKAFRRGENRPVPVEEIDIPDRLHADPETAVHHEESLARLTGAVRELGERCRELLRWKLLGKSFAEIQKIMGAASINTVYTWDARCRKQLLEKLGGTWEKQPK